MKPSDAAKLLALAAAFDRRTVGESDAIAWADALGGLSPADCAQAIRDHYAATTDWLMPAHIRTGVKRIRNERIRADMTDPAYALEDVAGGLAAIKARRRALADGHAQPLALPPINPSGQARVQQLVLARPVAACTPTEGENQ